MRTQAASTTAAETQTTNGDLEEQISAISERLRSACVSNSQLVEDIQQRLRNLVNTNAS